jgi:hypothetical protein
MQISACRKVNRVGTTPAAPSDLNAVLASPTKVNLTWIDNAMGESGFKIERKIGTGTYLLMGTTAANVAQFTDSTISANTSYTYRVYAFNSSKITSQYSNEVIVATSGAEPAWLNDGLVAYYPFNGNANDESGNGNNGAVNGATLTTDRFGNIGKAYNFNGISNYIRINNSSSLNNVSITISGWFNTNNLAANDNLDVKGIIGKWWQSPSVCNGNYNAYLVCLTKPLSQSSTFVGGATSFYEGNVFYASNAISTNSWYHFVFVHNSAVGGSLYINGNLVRSNSSKGIICNSLNSLNIGADINNGNLYRFFNGKIDDIRIYNRALSQSEVTYLATH